MFKTLPGFREFYPEDCAKKSAIFECWRKVARSFGFSEFEPPVLEALELFTEKSGEEIKSQLFEFVDKGGRAVSLRPEMTPSLARMVGAKANSLRRPVKWFAIGENYRYERQQKGRLRAFYQFNADILGDDSIAADAEAIALLIESLRVFGLSEGEFKLRLGDRILWSLFLESEGVGPEHIVKLLSVVDKIAKVSPEAFNDMMTEALAECPGANAQSLIERARKFVEIKSFSELEEFFSAYSGDVREKISARLENWRELLGILDAMGLGGFVCVDMGIVRGLAYYTGFVFEAFQTVGTGRALAGGGRYDALVKKLGYPDMPAVGFGMGDVTVADLLELVGKRPQTNSGIDAYAVIGSEEVKAAALSVIFNLRRLGLKIDYPFKLSGFGKQFKAADASGARFAIVFGQDEVQRGLVKLKNLASGEERELKFEALAEALK